jgi:hypothetical protein
MGDGRKKAAYVAGGSGLLAGLAGGYLLGDSGLFGNQRNDIKYGPSSGTVDNGVPGAVSANAAAGLFNPPQISSTPVEAPNTNGGIRSPDRVQTSGFNLMTYIKANPVISAAIVVAGAYFLFFRK